ncbi:MAG: HPr family phosphocarrier protein [Bdellovibrionaceae bacterium]|nr:HPr family phosphocarrier protein [Pseudobdellovibrionaceae bacterium]
MAEVKKVLLNKEGLHARPAGALAKAAAGFKSKIELQFNQKRVNAKSSLSLMTLGLSHNSEFTILADGEDSEQALKTLADLVDKEFKI